MPEPRRIGTPGRASSVNCLPISHFRVAVLLLAGLRAKPSGEWRYNQRGQLLEWWYFRLGEISAADQYRYDVDGWLRFVQYYDTNCSFSGLSTCTGPVEWTSYDDLSTNGNGRITESRTYLKLNGNWGLRNIAMYEYDAQEKVTKMLRYNSNQALTLTQTLIYDARGHVVTVREQSSVASPDLADRTSYHEYDYGRNSYFNTVYYASTFF